MKKNFCPTLLCSTKKEEQDDFYSVTQTARRKKIRVLLTVVEDLSHGPSFVFLAPTSLLRVSYSSVVEHLQ